MSQRTKKVASLIQQVVAEELREQVPAPEMSVTSVDVSPDLRNARVWLGIVSNEDRQKDLMAKVEECRSEIQGALAHRMTTKFVPRLSFEVDKGGEHADYINRLLKS